MENVRTSGDNQLKLTLSQKFLNKLLLVLRTSTNKSSKYVFRFWQNCFGRKISILKEFFFFELIITASTKKRTRRESRRSLVMLGMTRKQPQISCKHMDRIFFFTNFLRVFFDPHEFWVWVLDVEFWFHLRNQWRKKWLHQLKFAFVESRTIFRILNKKMNKFTQIEQN